MSGKRFHRALDGEVVHAESERADARSRPPPPAGARGIGSVANPEQDGRPLPRLHRHAEQPLVELERSFTSETVSVI